MGYVTRQDFGDDYFNELYSTLITGGGPGPSGDRCLITRHHHVLTFSDVRHGFCIGQVESWRKRDGIITDNCDDQCSAGYKNTYRDIGVRDVVYGPLGNPFGIDNISFTTYDICDACPHWPDDIPRLPGGVESFKEVKVTTIITEKKCLKANQVEAAARLIASPGWNRPENLDFNCLDFKGPGIDLVKSIGDCICRICNDTTGVYDPNAINNFFDELIACTDQIMLPSVPARSEKEKEAEWEACVQRAYENLCAI